MTVENQVLKELGWSDELIRAFTVCKDFPVVESAVTCSEPETRCVDTPTLLISEPSGK